MNIANEKRLIDAYKLEDLVRSNSARYHHVDDVIAAIAGQPTVDAMEVVRCKSCKHKGWIQEPCHGKSVDYCRVLELCIDNTEKCFCSYGERREGE